MIVRHGAVDTIAPGEPPAPRPRSSAPLGRRRLAPPPAASKARRADARRPFRLRSSADRIALRPARPRDTARMLLVEGETSPTAAVLDLPHLLRRGDVLVFNDTKVIPPSSKAGAARQHRRDPAQARRPARVAGLPPQRQARARRRPHRLRPAWRRRSWKRPHDGSALLHFHGDEPVEMLLERAGRMPLPPYIASKRPADEADRADYQTMFAREEGAVAAPTAALHFTDRLIAALDERAASGARR